MQGKYKQDHDNLTQELAKVKLNGDWEVDGWGPDYLSWSLPSGYSGTTSTSAGWIHNSSPGESNSETFDYYQS
ncbi:hypothetical protein [Lactobacillus pasteurii]|uniref:Uncharacterized protein n=1 Tax=Lactobacillus pasteurii DSM 23907 = CRBIP 24.76 TaxID=1423790 RepID=I7KL52_9LACO|nr:hypothetical protein [Lactobacillus pasteurii]CCI85084.1 Protein of unknown function [Lactobacillus pasteurii DSM 23907 = CRBIP 24.76]